MTVTCVAMLLFASYADVAQAVKRLRIVGVVHVGVGVCSACSANRIRLRIARAGG